MNDGFCDRCLEQHRLDIRDLERKPKLEVENNIAVGGLLKRFETERNEHIEKLEAEADHYRKWTARIQLQLMDERARAERAEADLARARGLLEKWLEPDFYEYADEKLREEARAFLAGGEL